jgi:hypothetical protein
MALFTRTQAELAQGGQVAVARLVKLEFTSGTKYLWDGKGHLQAGGQTWLGFGELGTMSGLEQAVQGTAPQAQFLLSGVDSDFVRYAAQSEIEVKDRPISVFLQFLSASMIALDDPVAIYVGLMDVMGFNANDPSSRSISVSAESIFIDRIRSTYSYYTDTDQKGRSPADRGLEFVATLKNKTVNWLRG